MTVCTSCGYENDATRVFCQNCGIRLPTDGAGSQPPPVPITQKSGGRKQKPGNESKEVRAPVQAIRPTSAEKSVSFGARFFRAIVSSLILGFLAALLIQAIRPPLNIVPVVQADQARIDAVRAELQEGVDSTYPRVVRVSNADMNTVLATVLSAEAGAGLVRFDRAYVECRDGRFRLTRVGIYGPASVYLMVEGTLSKADAFEATVTAGEIGRLPVDPRLAGPLAKWFDPVATGLIDLFPMVNSARSVRCTPDGLELDFAGKASVR